MSRKKKSTATPSAALTASELGNTKHTPRAEMRRRENANIARVEKFRVAIDTYPGHESDDDVRFRDLLADAMHWCDHESIDFDGELEIARANYAAEKLP